MSIIWAMSRGHHREHRLVLVLERQGERTVHHEHTDQLAAHHGRHRHSALGVVERGKRYVDARADRAVALERPPHGA